MRNKVITFLVVVMSFSFGQQLSATATTGLGGYAVIHPDGHVCGVIVANASDPFGNGGVMTTEYMGCPAGALIIFQTKPSPSGNVAGWHGPDVIYRNGSFTLSGGTTITNGIATDPNGRVWDTGSGATITPATVIAPTSPPLSETSTTTSTPETPTPTSTPTPAPTPTPTPTSTPTTTPTPPTGLGGYAVIHPSGHVCGVIVGNSYFAGNDKTMTSEYMGCPIGALIVFQTKPSPSGNVAGWHGLDVIYRNGTFTLSSGTTITNGIATDPNGRVWDTGSGETIKAGVVTTPVQSETKTATTQSETKTATTQSETNTVSPQTNAISPNIQPETKSATTSDGIKSQQSVVAEKIETVIDSDGEEVVPEANLKVKKDNSGRITFTITSNLPEEAVIITASKKGSKSIRYSVTTNDSGRASLRTTRNLSGYTLTLRFDSEVLDQLKFKG